MTYILSVVSLKYMAFFNINLMLGNVQTTGLFFIVILIFWNKKYT